MIIAAAGAAMQCRRQTHSERREREARGRGADPASPAYAVVSNAAGAKQPASPGLGPHSGSRKRDCRHDRRRACHLIRSSGISPKLTNRAPARSVFLTTFSSVRVRGTPFSRRWDTPRMAGRNRAATV